MMNAAPCTDQLEALLARLPAACLDPPVLDLGSDDDDEDADEAVAPAATSAVRRRSALVADSACSCSRPSCVSLHT